MLCFAKVAVLVLAVASLQVVNSYQHCSSQRLTDHYWSQDLQTCLPCTRCHDQRLITLIGCAPDKDTLCGTIEDLRHQWLLPSLQKGDDITTPMRGKTTRAEKVGDEDEVFGRTRYGPPETGGKKYYDATQRVKESVKNASEKKSEFLRKLQEIEQISVSKKSKEEQDEVDGMIHFAQDEYSQSGQTLHQDLEMIEQELLKDSETTTSTSTQSSSSTRQRSYQSIQYSTASMMTSTTASSIGTAAERVKTTTPRPTPPNISEWFNGNSGVMEAATEDGFGQQHFFATRETSFSKNNDVYGAIVQEPEKGPAKVGQGHDEFGLLTHILYRQSAQEAKILNEAESSSTTTNMDGGEPTYIALKLEHILVLAGFCIGFGLVFCVGIVYIKFKPRGSAFKMLNNQSAATQNNDSSSLSSGASSFQQTDSRLTSLTASPLISQAQSPIIALHGSQLLATSPMLSVRGDVSPSLLNAPDSRQAYVDQRGRTLLKQARELPV